jgi:hypothetical protein
MDTMKCEFFAKTVILKSISAYVILICCKKQSLPEDGVDKRQNTMQLKYD